MSTTSVPIGFAGQNRYISNAQQKTTATPMALQKEPPDPSSRNEPEFDSNDAGWDPYVTSLLSSGAPSRGTPSDDDDEALPVMTITRLTRGSGRAE
jgi:hypothetical protein